MALTLDDRDSPVLRDVQQSFVGGQFSNAVPLQLSVDQCSLIEDCDVEVTGKLVSRFGTNVLGGDVGGGTFMLGIGYYKNATVAYPVGISGTSGDNEVKKYDFFTNSWVELIAGDTQKFLGANDVTFVTGNAFLYVTDPNDATTPAIRRFNGTAWATLTTDSPPTKVKYLIWHTNRLVAANASISGTASPDGVFFSGILADNVWAGLTGGYQIQVGAGDGFPITGIASWTTNNIAVFKQNSVWLIGADPLLDVADMQVQMVHGRIGCIAPKTIAQVGSDIFFLSNDGIRSLQQTIASESRYELGKPISFPVQDVLKRMNRNFAFRAAATFWKGKYIFAFPIDSSQVNNHILIYDSTTGAWSGSWTNLPVSCFGVRSASEGEFLMMGASNAPKILNYLGDNFPNVIGDTLYTDWDGDFVAPRVITRGMIFGDLYTPKKGLVANVVLNNSKGTIKIKGIFDEGAFFDTNTVDTGDPAGFPLPFTLPITFPRPGVQVCSISLRHIPKFHQIQFELTGTSIGRKEIRQIIVEAFPEATDLIGRFEAIPA